VAGELPWTSAQVHEAWHAFWEVATKRTPGGASAALLTQFNDAGRGMRGDRSSCTLEHQASFMRGVYQNYGGDRFTFTQFPAGRGDDRWVEVSVDVAALFTEAPSAARMMKELATAEVQGIWPKRRGSGAFSVHDGVPVAAYGTETDRRIRRILFGEKGIKFCLDAADLMPGPVRDAFYRGAKEYLSKPDRLSKILSRLDRAARENRSDVKFPVCA
jgi:alpha-glucoside transport system substrate-binding protein